MKLIFPKNATSVTVDVFIQDSSSTVGAGLGGLVFNSGGLVAYYKTPRIAWTAISLITQTVTGGYSSGGFVDNGTVTGSYRLDIPNAAFSAGTNQVQVAMQGATNMAPMLLEIQLTNFDLNQSAPNVTTTNAVQCSLVQSGAINAASLSNDTITATKVATGAITAAKFAADAIDSTVLATGAITAAKFAADAITSTVLQDNAITAGKIATNAITSAKIASSAIGASQIAAAAIASTKFASGAITDDAFAVGAIGAAKIGNNAITSLVIADNSITANKIQADAITATKIATGTVTAAKFAADAITSTVLANDAITETKIATGAFTATKPDAGFLAAIKAEALSAANDYGAIKPTTPGRTLTASATGAVPVADDGIGPNSFSTGSITAASIAAGAITSAKFAASAITEAAFAADAVGPTKIKIGAGSFEAGAIDSNVLANSAITATKIASVAFTAAKFDTTYSQAVRDTMKLAPTAGSPASGSVDDHLNTVDDVYTEIVDHRSDMSSTETFFANRRIAEGLTPAQTGLSDVTRQVKLGASALARDYVGAQVFLKALTGTRDQIRRVVAWDDSNRIATINTPWTVNPASGQQVNFVIDAFQEHGQLHEWTGTELRYKASALSQAPAAGASLTAQEVRDAMKLDASAGQPAIGSVDRHLDEIETGLTNAGLSQQEVRDAMKLAPSGGAPATGAIDDKIDNIPGGLTAQEVRDSLLLEATGGGAAIDTRLTSIAGNAQTASDASAFLAFRENTFYTSKINDIETQVGFNAQLIADVPSQQEVRDAMALAPTPGVPGVGSIDETLDGNKTSLQAIVAAIPTQQEIRDSMKLAPTAGDPDFGSIDADLDTISAGVSSAVGGIGSLASSVNGLPAAIAASEIVDSGTLPFQSGVTDINTQAKLANTAPAANGQLVGSDITLETPERQRRKIVAYDGPNEIITVDEPWTDNPGQGDAYTITLGTTSTLSDEMRVLVADKVADRLTIPYTATNAPTSLQGRIKILADMVENAGSYYRFETTALEQAPSGGGGGGGGQDELVTTTVNSVTSPTEWVLNGGPSNTGALVGSMVVRTKPDGRISVNRITAYDGGTTTVTVESSPSLTVETGDTINVIAKMPGQSLTEDQVTAAVLDADATLHQQIGSVGKAIGDPGISTSTIYSRVHALLDLSTQQVTDACDDALQNFNGPTVADIAEATRIEIDDNGLSSQVIQGAVITAVTNGQNFRIDAPINGVADRYQRIAVVGKKTGTRNPGVGRLISTIDTSGNVVSDDPFPETPQIGDQVVLVGYYS